MKQYGIIGFPLTHSFSQDYFNRKFESLGLTGHRYDKFPIRSIEELLRILLNNPDLNGLNITMPFKRSVMELLDDRSGIPAGLEACNCIKLEGGKLFGFNTDITGFQRSLEPLLRPHHKKALILGTGGASDAVRFVMEKLGKEYRMVSRNKNGTNHLTYADIGVSEMETHQLIINTTPLGTFPDVDLSPDIPYPLLNSGHLLFDLVYNPAKTVFLKKGEERGAVTRNGYEMLVIQAEESWDIWKSA